MSDKPGPVTLGSRRGPRPKAGLRGVTLDVRGGIPHQSRAGLRVPLAAAALNGTATGAFSRGQRPSNPLAGRSLPPRAVEGTTAQGRLWGAKRDHLKLPLCRPRPRTLVGAGPPRRDRARRTLLMNCPGGFDQSKKDTPNIVSHESHRVCKPKPNLHSHPASHQSTYFAEKSVAILCCNNRVYPAPL